MEDVHQQLEELTNTLLDEREARLRLEVELQSERDFTARLATDLREAIYQVAEPLNASLAKKAGVADVQEQLSLLEDSVAKLARGEKENNSAMRVLMETVEDTMPIDDTHRLLRELEEKMDDKMQSQMEEIAVELSDSEERLQQQLGAVADDCAAQLAAAPWSGDVGQLEARLGQTEQLANTSSSRVESGLGELDRKLKLVTAELTRSVAQAADVRHSTLAETGKLSEGIAALDSKVDEASRQLAARIDDRATTLDNETAELAAQVDATLEKVYGRMDAFTTEVQQFVAQQDGKWRSNADTAKELHAAVATLRGDAEALGVRATHAETSAEQGKEEMASLQDKHVQRLEQHIDRARSESEQTFSGVKATLERVQRQTIDSAERIDAVNATVAQLGGDIAACGKDVAQSIDDALLCRQELQHSTQRFDARMADVADELHTLEASVAGRLARHEARAEAINADAERGESRNAELAAALQSAFEKHVDSADKLSAELASRVQEIENDAAASKQQWLSSFEALETQQSSSTEALTQKTEDLTTTMDRTLDDVRAELERNVAQSWSEQGDRLASTSTQLRDAMESVRANLDRQMDDMDAAQRSSLDRMNADLSSRLDQMRDSFDESLSRAMTEERAARAKLESDLGLLVDRSMGTVEQQVHERSAAHDTKLAKATSGLSTQVQTVRDELERITSDGLSSMDAQLKKTELDAHENFEKQRFEMTRVQTEVTQSVAQAVDTAKHELATYVAAQERAAKDTQLATSNAIEDASSGLEARVTERTKSSESRLVDAVSGLGDDLQKTRADLDGAMRERMSSLDSGMRALETAIRSEVEGARNELKTSVAELATEQDTKLSKSEVETGDRFGEVEDSFRTQLEALDAGLRRRMQEGLADAEGAYTKIHSELALALDNKCSALQAAQQEGDAQLSVVLMSNLESTRSALASAITTAEQGMEQRCSDVHDFAEQSTAASKEQLEATMAQQVAQLAGQSAQLEADVGKLVEGTCAALDEHWSGRLSEQTQRIAEFESAIVKSADTSAADLKQHVNQVVGEQSAQLRHLVSQTNDFDLKIGDLKASVEGEWASVEEKRATATESAAEVEARVGQLETNLQTAVMEMIGGLSAQVNDNQTEQDARLGELEGLVNKVTAQHVATAQSVDETQGQLSKLYTDMAELVQTAQLTIEEQMNASVAAQDRRMGEAEQVAEAVIARVGQGEATAASFDSALGQITELVGSVSDESAKQMAEGAMQVGQRMGELESLANTNLARVTEQAERLAQFTSEVQQDIEQRDQTLTNRITEDNNALVQMQSVLAQADARVKDIEGQINLSTATMNEQYALLTQAQNGVNEQVAQNLAAVQGSEGAINRNVAAVEELKGQLIAVTEEVMQTIDDTVKNMQDTTANIATDVAARVGAVTEQVGGVQRTVQDTTARLGDVETSINIGTAKAAEAAETIKSLCSALDEAADLSKAQLSATAQASETRALGVETRLEDLAGVLGQEVQNGLVTVREEVEGMLAPYDGRVTELEAAVNTGVVRMANTEARLEEVSAASTAAMQETKAQLGDVDKLLEAESSGVAAQLRDAQRKAESTATELRGLVEERVQAEGRVQTETLTRVQADVTEVKTRAVAELNRQQASTDAQLKKLQNEVWSGTYAKKSSSDIGSSTAASPEEVDATRVGRLEEKTETLKVTVGQALDMMGRLRGEHGARLNRLEDTSPGAAPGRSSMSLVPSSSSAVSEGVPGIAAETLRRIADEFGRMSGGGDSLNFAQAEECVHTLGFVCGSSYLAEVWGKYDQGQGKVDFSTFCTMWLFVTEGSER